MAAFIGEDFSYFSHLSHILRSQTYAVAVGVKP